jgi:type I restriction enzyme S subunit
MKKYEQYVDSGFEWVGLVPKDWRQTQLKYISTISKGKKAKEDFQDFLEGMVPYLSMEYLRNQTQSPSFVYANDPNIVLVVEQDLLILWDGSKAGEIVKAKKGALSSTMGKIHVESELFDLNYLTYYLKNAERYIQANTVGMGIPHVSGEELRTLYITFPDKEIQTKIAQYLDHQTAIIDQLIQQKEKLFELLQEKRQSVINEAVTKGLNPNVKMKDSGIEWLGVVPEHWKVSYLKRFCHRITDGAHFSPKTEFEGRNYISVKDVDEFGNIDLINCKKISQTDYDDLVRNGCQALIGDVLLTKDGTIGRAAVVTNNDFVALSSLGILTPDKTILNSEYLRLFLISGINVEQMFSLIAGAALTRLTIEKMKHLVISLPPLKEQLSIVSYLIGKVKTFDYTLELLMFQIEKLKEYRQSLISEAVTGKIDVRDWQPNN